MSKNLRYKCIIFVLFVQFIFLVPSCFGGEGRAGNRNGGDLIPDIRTKANERTAVPVLTIAPREIDFGDIGPESLVNSLFSLKNVGGGALQWSTAGPEGWSRTGNQELEGSLVADQGFIRMTIKSLKDDLPQTSDKNGTRLHNIELTLETGGNVLVATKKLSAGNYREPLKITYNGGTRTIFLNFAVTDVKSLPPLDVEPLRIDFGISAPGRQIARQIRITNRGRDTVTWRVARQGEEKSSIAPFKGRYVSFFNDDSRGSETYIPATHIKDVLELSGIWVDKQGYPSCYGEGNSLRFRFVGTGIGAYFRHGPDGGQVAAYIDDQLVHVYDGKSHEPGSEELPIVEGLPDGQHVLTLVNGDGQAIVEGVCVFGRDLMKGPPDWISVVPDNGTTTREIDYVNIRMNTQQLNPGFYGDRILLSSNRGNMTLEAFVEIRAENVAKFLDVYRYVRNQNYLYTTNPQAEAARIHSGRYMKEGIAFRLFAPGTPGTTEFKRWYSMKRDDHFYSYTENSGGKFWKDYALEGSIGNIATSKLTNTRELYRWYNPETGRHFYTTDQKGEGMTRKGYKFDGIAGYVR